ncbi:MAG TPA: hypothetical protein VEI03_15195 [Stellaceae bacterium]|nr:hypothetical protein [Stellaceae bacterium]
MAAAKSRKPRLAMTVQLAKKGGMTPEEAKQMIADAINRIPSAKLKNLRDGQLTVIL